MPLQPAPMRPQATRPSGAPAAVNWTWPPVLTCADEGETVTEAAARTVITSSASIDTAPAIL